MMSRLLFRLHVAPTAFTYLAVTGTVLLAVPEAPRAQLSCVGVPAPRVEYRPGETDILTGSVNSEVRTCLPVPNSAPTTSVTYGNATVGSSGSVALFVPGQNTDPDKASVLTFLNSSVAAGTGDFVSRAAVPFQLNGNLRVNFVNTSIGSGRSMTFLPSNGSNVDPTSVYIVSDTPTTYDDLTVSGATSFTVGAYKIATLINRPSDITFTNSSIAATSNIDVLSGSKVTIDGSTNLTALNFDISGTLAGSGTVNGLDLTLGSNGIIAPGSSIGTLTVNSDVRVLPGATLEAEIDPSGAQNADLLQVNSSIRGGSNLTIQVQPVRSGLTASEIAAANDYTVLQATSLDGAPAVVEGGSLPALVTVNTVGDPTRTGNVILRFSELPTTQLQTTSPVTSSGNQNHSGIATALGIVASTGTAGPAGGTASPSASTVLANGTSLGTAVGSLTNNQLAAFNNVHGEAYASHLTVNLEQLDQLAGVVMDHTSGLGVPFGVSGAPGADGSTRGEVEARRRVWADLGYVSGDVDGEGGLGDFNYNLFTGVAGVDLLQSPLYNAGVFVGGGTTGMDEHDLIDQKFDTTSVFAGVYGRYTFDWDVTLSGTAAYARGWSDAVRNLDDVGNFTGGQAKADFNSNSFLAGLRVQRPFEFDSIDFTPYAGATYAYTSQGTLNESGGGDFNFSVDDATADSLVLSLGGNLSHDYEMGEDVFRPVAFARYEYDALARGDENHDIQVTSPVFGSFNQVGQNRGAHGVVAGLGFTFETLDTVGISAGYLYSLRSNGEEHGVRGNVTIRF